MLHRSRISMDRKSRFSFIPSFLLEAKAEHCHRNQTQNQSQGRRAISEVDDSEVSPCGDSTGLINNEIRPLLDVCESKRHHDVDVEQKVDEIIDDAERVRATDVEKGPHEGHGPGTPEHERDEAVLVIDVLVAGGVDHVRANLTGFADDRMGFRLTAD